MRVLALALAILIMVSSCLAANRKVLKPDVPKHEDTIVHGRQLLDDGGDAKAAGYPGSSVNNHHYIPREKYPGGGGDGDGSG